MLFQDDNPASQSKMCIAFSNHDGPQACREGAIEPWPHHACKVCKVWNAFSGMWHSHDFFQEIGINYRCRCFFFVVWYSWLSYIKDLERKHLPPNEVNFSTLHPKIHDRVFQQNLWDCCCPGKVRPKERAKGMLWRAMREICRVGSWVGPELVVGGLLGQYFFGV